MLQAQKDIAGDAPYMQSAGNVLLEGALATFAVMAEAAAVELGSEADLS